MTAFTTTKPTLATHRLECQIDLSRMALAADPATGRGHV